MKDTGNLAALNKAIALAREAHALEAEAVRRDPSWEGWEETLSKVDALLDEAASL